MLVIRLQNKQKYRYNVLSDTIILNDFLIFANSNELRIEN